MSNRAYELNPARQIARDTFYSVLRQFNVDQQITEQKFAQLWLDALSSVDEITVNGWYDPPQNGLAVLSGIPRINFSSLRDEKNLPGEQLIDWAEGALFAYCSPVHVDSGLLGDFGITHYFGSDPLIKEHFRKTYQATQEVLNFALNESSSQRLFRQSNNIFADYGLRNCVVSYTDTVQLDLGHTYPQLADLQLTRERKLEKKDRDRIRRARRFLNEDSDWDLTSNGQFTIEPQLININDSSLPQVSYHYVIVPGLTPRILNEQDVILQDYGLTL